MYRQPHNIQQQPIIRDDRNMNPNQYYMMQNNQNRFAQPDPMRIPQNIPQQRQPLPQQHSSQNYNSNNTNQRRENNTNNTNNNTNTRAPPSENKTSEPPKDNRESSKRKREEENKKKKEENEKIEQVEKLFKRSNAKANILKRDREYLCKIKFQNRLPDPPLGPKYLQIDNDLKRFIDYKPTHLEQNFKYSIITGPTLGIPIDFVDPVTYTMPRDINELEEGDRTIIQPDFGSNRSRRNEINTAELSWLTKPQYLSSEYSELFAPSSKIRENKEQGDNSETIDKDIEKIEESFKTSDESNFVHPSNPKMKIKKVYDVFPDFELWTNTYAHVLHDQDPLRDMDHIEDKPIKRRNALLMPMSIQDKKGSMEYNAYIIPEDDSLTSYQWHREYFAKKISGDDLENSFLFRFSDETVTYKPLKMRLELSGATTQDQKEQLSRINRPSRILIEKRSPDELEKEEAKNTMETLYEPWLDLSSSKKELSDDDFDN